MPVEDLPAIDFKKTWFIPPVNLPPAYSPSEIFPVFFWNPIVIWDDEIGGLSV